MSTTQSDKVCAIKFIWKRTSNSLVAMVLWGGLVGAIPSWLAAAEQIVALEPVEQCSTFFAESNTQLHYRIRSVDRYEGTVRWVLAANHRTIARGERAVATARRNPATVELSLRFPPLNDGVILPVQLTVIASHTADAPADAEATQTLWLFPKNPFEQQETWLKQLDLALFDPEKTTGSLLDDAEVPFRLVRSLGALAEVDHGLVLIGEGVSWRTQRGLPELLQELAAAGRPVLCLAPREGMMPLPKQGIGPGEAMAMTFRGSEIVARIDKRLDAGFWSAKQPRPIGLALRLDIDRVVAEVAEESGGWPWLEIDYHAPSGRLVVCGFGLASHWDEGPTPRFLFARLLHYLSDRPRREGQKTVNANRTSTSED